MKAFARLLCLVCFTSTFTVAQTRHPEWRALLASPGLDGQPIKGVYFFPGESDPAQTFYTAHPIYYDDTHWNSNPAGRVRIVDRMLRAHVNTIVMSYWSDMPQWSPMILDASSVPGVLEAARGKPIVILPTIEGGAAAANPQIPQWDFPTDFPHPAGSQEIAPGLVKRIQLLQKIFADHMDQWARVYDKDGNPRYAINLLHVCSEIQGVDDNSFAAAFDEVAKKITIPIGFTLDFIGGSHKYVASPKTAGPLLAGRSSVLAALGYESEVFSGKIKNGDPCSAIDWHACQPFDNNRSNLENIANWKKAAVQDWVASGLPLILDVSNGFDGRIVWRSGGTGFWGDNLNYTEDRWRNWLSELKGLGNKGIVMDTWNGYTEGYNAVPTFEHLQIDYGWLTDLMEPDPRDCSHMHYAGGIPTFRVYGAICEKWIQLGADRAFGPPVSNETATPNGRGRVSRFADGKAIYWSNHTFAHEVHGLIAKAYLDAKEDNSCLGLPTSDEIKTVDGAMNNFEFGTIRWTQGDSTAQIVCK